MIQYWPMGGICSRSAEANDPKAYEKLAMQGSKRLTSGSMKFNPSFPCIVNGYAGATLGAKKHQDRFLIEPHFANGALYCGVFDGHAEQGGIIAERASGAIKDALRQRLSWLSDEESLQVSICSLFMRGDAPSFVSGSMGTIP